MKMRWFRAGDLLLIPGILIGLLILWSHFSPYFKEHFMKPPPSGEVRGPGILSLLQRPMAAYYEISTDEPVVAIIGQGESAIATAVSPDGRFIATGHGLDSEIRISDVRKKRVVEVIALWSGGIEELAYSPDGRYLVSGRDFMAQAPTSNSVDIWDAQTGALVRQIAGPSPPLCTENDVKGLTFSPDSLHLAVGYSRGMKSSASIRIYEFPNGTLSSLMQQSDVVAGGLAIIPEKGLLVYGGYGQQFHIHDLKTGKRIKQLITNASDTNAVTREGRYLISGTSDLKLVVRDLETGKTMMTLTGPKGHFRRLAVSPDGRYVATDNDDGFRLWDLKEGKMLRELKAHPSRIISWVGFDPAGRFLVAGGGFWVTVWDFRKLIERREAK
jgi:WD40 repeat protein